MTSHLTADGAYPGLQLTLHDPGILEIVIRSEKTLNSVDAAAHRALTRVWRDIDDTPGVRCVLIRGEGRGFSSGGDFALIEEMSSDFTALARVWKEARDLVYNVVNCGKPIVSAIHGPCVGAGLARSRCWPMSVWRQSRPACSTATCAWAWRRATTPRSSGRCCAG